MKEPAEHKQEKEKCILVGIATPKVRPWLAQEQLAELGRLAETAGAIVTATYLQRVQNFSPATLIGEGKVEEIKHALSQLDAKMVVFDNDLSGSQVRNLEQRLPGIKVLDRTGLILDEEGHPIGHSTPHKPEYHVHFATDPDLGDDLYVRLICSR